jgi:hypothetical protein
MDPVDLVPALQSTNRLPEAPIFMIPNELLISILEHLHLIGTE